MLQNGCLCGALLCQQADHVIPAKSYSMTLNEILDNWINRVDIMDSFKIVMLEVTLNS